MGELPRGGATTTTAIDNALGEALLQWFCNNSNNTSSDAADGGGGAAAAAAASSPEASFMMARCEVLVSLQAWLEHGCCCYGREEEEEEDPVVGRLDAILTQIWYATVSTTTSGECDGGADSSSATTKEEEEEAGIDDSSSAAPSQPQQQQLMDQTLTALLDQTSLLDDNDSHPTDRPGRLFQDELTHHLWLRLGVRVAAQRLPAFWRPWLSQWLSLRRSKTRTMPEQQQKSGKNLAAGATAADSFARRQSQAAQALLMILQTYAQANGSDVARVLLLVHPSSDDDDDHGGNSSSSLADDVTQLILACVVSAAHDSDEVRVLAWMTAATLVRSSAGWEWLLLQPQRQQQQPSSSSGLGSMSKLCAMVRFAAGEWKIQLATLVNKSNEEVEKVANDEASPGLLLVEVCAQILVLAVDYMVVLSDRMDDDDDDDDNNTEGSVRSLRVPGDAILHIRRSFEEALNSAVQYLGLAERRSKQVDGPVVRVLAQLLTEFDVFATSTPQRQPSRSSRAEQNDKAVTADDDDNSPECASLLALRVAMEIATNDDDDDLQETLLPSLAAVFASAEGSMSHVSLLKEYGLLGGGDNNLGQFLETYWRRFTNNDDMSSVSWACQLIELWVSLDRICETSQVQGAIVQFLQRMLREQPSSLASGFVGALSAAVGCYVTLQGNEPPGEPDATVLQQVLELCARFEQS